jgi:hypothetical protein
VCKCACVRVCARPLLLVPLLNHRTSQLAARPTQWAFKQSRKMGLLNGSQGNQYLLDGFLMKHFKCMGFTRFFLAPDPFLLFFIPPHPSISLSLSLSLSLSIPLLLHSFALSFINSLAPKSSPPPPFFAPLTYHLLLLSPYFSFTLLSVTSLSLSLSLSVDLNLSSLLYHLVVVPLSLSTLLLIHLKDHFYIYK